MTAELLRNEDGYEYGLTQTGPAAYTAVANYKVWRAAFEEALVEPGVPLWDDPWSAEMPTLRASFRKCHLDGGGWTRVEVRYATPTGGGTINPGPGGRLTEIDTELGSETVYFAVDGTTRLNPEGAPITTVGVKVTSAVYYADGFPDLAPMIALARPSAVNDAPVTLKNLHGLGEDVTFGAGQLKYLGPRLGVDEGVPFVRHGFHAADDWLHRWRTSTDTEAPGEQMEAPVYREASFAPLGL